MVNRRQLNLVGLACCAGLMAYALYAQYALNLEPCPLCVFQRVAIIALGIVFLVAAVHNAGNVGSRVYAGLVFMSAGAGVAVAGRHLWLQNLPPDKVPSCGPGLDFMLDSFPFTEVLNMVLTGSGECATIDWSFLGFSMPAWVLIAAAVLGVAGISANLFARR